MVNPGETVHYLGVDVDPKIGIVKPKPIPLLQKWITRIKDAPLKPTQRVKLLNVYAIPRLLYQADLCDVSATTLKALDNEIRGAVKAWLHLAPSTCNGILYSRHRDGGLGIVSLEKSVPPMQAKRILKLSRSSDQWTRQTAVTRWSAPVWKRKWVLAGGKAEEVPALTAESGLGVVTGTPVLRDWRKEEGRAWAQLQVQGVGVSSFLGDRVSNSWLMEPAAVGFRQRHYIAALALRAGTYPTREFLSRGRNKVTASCRRCSARLESSSHILGQCEYVKDSRMRRHHKICDLLAKEAERFGWKAHREVRVTLPEGGLRIPDLVCVKEDIALVIDVTVRYELAEDTLELAAAEKKEKYKDLTGLVRERMNVGKVEVLGFPIGARGKWPACNNQLLRTLGLTAARRVSFAKLLSRRALLYSLDVLRDFLR